MNITAVAIVAISCWCLVEIINSGKDKKRKKQNDVDTKALENEVLALKSRIETLEQIVTDEKYHLHREFEALKKNNVV